MNANRPPSMEAEETAAENSGNEASIGGLLRAARKRRNEDFSKVSSALRIRQIYLEAIENNQFEDLPGAIYATGFIRTYAEYLGLDGEEIVRRYKSESSSSENVQDLTFPGLVPQHGIPGGAIVMLGLVLAAIGYGSWYYVSTKNTFVTEQVPAVPEKLASLIGEKPVATEPLKTEETAPPVEAVPENTNENTDENTTESADESVAENTPKEAEETVEEKVEEKAEAAVEKIETATVEEKISETEPSLPAAPTENLATAKAVKPIEPTPKIEPAATPKPAAIAKVEPVAEPVSEPVVEHVETKKVAPEPKAVVKPAPRPAPKVAVVQPQPAPKPAASPPIKPTGSSGGPSRITLRAVSDSYIQVRDNNADQLLITRLLKKGQSYQVPDRSDLSLITGNAGALEILVDGNKVPSIGPIGAIRRNVVLEAEKLIKGTAVIE